MKVRLPLFIALAAVAFSCKDEVETPPGTTPYTFEEARLGKLGKPLVPANNPMTVEGVELGRMLFYDKKLSADNSLACGTCHQQKYAFTDGGKAFSLGVGGAVGKHNAMSLTNVVYDKHFNWNGSAQSLEEQAQIPMESPIEMHQNLDRAINKLQNTPQYPPLFLKAFGSKVITGENILKAIGQFERTLISANSNYDKSLKREYVLSASEQRGLILFQTHPTGQDPSVLNVTRGGNCGDCHTVGHFTDHDLKNNGLDEILNDNGLGGFTGKSTDNGKFKVPTLRNIELTGPYMHDGRFKTLDDVLDHYNLHVNKNSPNLDPQMFSSNKTGSNPQLGLSPEEKADIIAFLKTLTDTSFVNDPRFSDPFKK